ncbi:MAG: tetratricopeptide repeat protein [Bacteroidales bacterium]|nr:tetratricopeptide repeat protein [Bacteroidales bacterium]
MKNHLTWFILTVCLIALLLNCREDSGDKNLLSRTPVFDTASINAVNRYALEIVRKEPDSTIFFANRTHRQSVSLGYRTGIGEAYYLKGIAYFYKYQYDSAINLYKKAYAIFSEENNRYGMARVLYSMSYNYSLTHDMQKSLECMQNARKLFEEDNNISRVYECLEGLIYVHKQLHEEKAVDSLISELIIIAEKTGDSKKLANSYFTLGNYYFNQAYLKLAIEAFYKALQMAEESGDPVEIANAVGSVGRANLYMGEYQSAIDYYKRQEVILKKLNNVYELSITYTDLGEAYNALKDYGTGLSYHLMAYDIRRKMNFQLAISNSLHNIGNTYFLMEDSNDLALDYTNQSLEINREINNYEGLAKNYMLMGKIHRLKRNISASISYLEQSLALARQYNMPDVIMESSGVLSHLYARKNNFRQAITCMEIYNEISDSIASGENYKRITQLEMQNAFDKKQNEVEMAHREEKIEYETELRRNKLVRNYSLLLGLLVISFGIYMFYNYRRSRKANKEKEALLKEIHHRVKNNLMVVSSLLNLQSGSITDDKTKSAVKESQSRVKSMALIHQLLYQSEMFTSIDFAKYLKQLMSSLQNTYSHPGKNITYSIRADNIRLDIDTAIPLGLITNELATNAYKYAFVDSAKGKIEIDFCKTTDHKYLLRILDNGKGLPQGFEPDNSTTLGLKLVKILSKQIKATFKYRVNNGTEFNIVFSEIT